MRVSLMAVAVAGVVLAGCETVPSLHLPKAPWSKSTSSKSGAMPTRASCPAMKGEYWKPIVDAAVHKAFDRDLQKRFGDTAVHMRIGWSKTDKGNTVITALRIGPAKYAMPEVGKGGEVELVFRACTGERLSTHKLANLERNPRTVADAASEGVSASQERPTPRKRGFKWPWKS